MAFWLCVYWFCCFALCSAGLPVLSLMFGFVWPDFAALPCGWLNSVVLALYGLVLLFALMQSNVVALLSGMVWICLWFCLFSLILTENPYLWCIHFYLFYTFYSFLPLFTPFSYLFIPFNTFLYPFFSFFFYGWMYTPCLPFWRKREKWAKKYVYACGWVSMYLFLMYCSGCIVVAWLCCVVYACKMWGGRVVVWYISACCRQICGVGE